MSEALRGVIFDLDGTIAETHPMAIGLIGESIARFGGANLDAEQILSLFGRNEMGIFREMVGPGWEGAWDFYLGSYVDRHQICPDPFPGMTGILESLVAADVPLGLITGKTATTGSLSLDVLGLTPLFADIRGGSMDRVTKRDDIVGMVEGWGVAPDSVAYVGDTVSDMVEAGAAGVMSVAACWSQFVDATVLAAAGPDELFVEVAEFGGWVAGMLSEAPV